MTRRFGLTVGAILALGAVSACLGFRLETQGAVGKSGQPLAAQLPAGGAAAVEVEPQKLAELLSETKAERPVVLHVGFKNFYEQARIPGSDYAGPGATRMGLELLRKRVNSLPRGRSIVLYCGCCPWDKCPNVRPAYEALHAMGFSNVKVLHIAQNFGANWVNAGYPTTRGE